MWDDMSLQYDKKKIVTVGQNCKLFQIDLLSMDQLDPV